MTNTKYRDIPNFEGIYGISEYGECIRYEQVRPYKIKGYFSTYKQITLKQASDKKGYHRLQLRKNGEHHMYAVHRLVYMTYVGPIDKNLQINHIDGNKSNNHISNLEMCTGLENIRHAWKNGLKKSLFGEKNPATKLKLIEVIEIRKLYNTKRYSTRKLAKKYNISKSVICSIINNKTWKSINN